MSDIPLKSSETDSLSKEIDELNREKQQLISLVSHDLRSPLNRAFALAELLLMDQESLTDFQKDYLEKMRLVIADGLAMMRNLVDYRNLEFRSIDIMPDKINVSEFVDKLAREFQTTADKKGITLTIQHRDNLIITSDKQCLDRAVGNLLSNALKFSKSGKQVFLRTFKNQDNSAAIEIEDEIGGFSPDEQATLFIKFKKYKAQPTGNESSTGLGLFVANAMTARIGGTISYKACKDNSGSIFTIVLPSTLN
jgi:signal transduction histidine kinase